MIYVEISDGKHIVILTEKDFRVLRKGKPVMAPSDSVLLGYTRDEEHTMGMIESMATTTGRVIDTELLTFIFEESAKVKKCSSKNAGDAASEPSSNK